MGIPNPSCPEWYLGVAHAAWRMQSGYACVPCAHLKHTCGARAELLGDVMSNLWGTRGLAHMSMCTHLLTHLDVTGEVAVQSHVAALL